LVFCASPLPPIYYYYPCEDLTKLLCYWAALLLELVAFMLLEGFVFSILADA
jgi:hypothetical protein